MSFVDFTHPACSRLSVECGNDATLGLPVRHALEKWGDSWDKQTINRSIINLEEF